MRFQGQSTASLPSPVPPGPVSYGRPGQLSTTPVLDSTVLKETSGQTGSLIPGSPGASIQLHTLIISWSGMDIPGELNLTGENYQEVLSIDLAGSAGSIPLSFDPPMPVTIGEQGLSVTNNSSGGRYSITVYYSHA